jgi:hypothetical protein
MHLKFIFATDKKGGRVRDEDGEGDGKGVERGETDIVDWRWRKRHEGIYSALEGK